MQSAKLLYILKVDLARNEINDPGIYRTLSCPANKTFEDLHWALQVALGWASTHTYDFKIRDPDVESEPEYVLFPFLHSSHSFRSMRERMLMIDLLC
jgi:hypothetical protein